MINVSSLETSLCGQHTKIENNLRNVTIQSKTQKTTRKFGRMPFVNYLQMLLNFVRTTSIRYYVQKIFLRFVYYQIIHDSTIFICKETQGSCMLCKIEHISHN